MRYNLLRTPLYIIAIFVFVGISSCEIINPGEDIPFYLRIDSISFIDSTKVPAIATKPGAHLIKDAWVFVDGIFKGTYELPSTIPIYAGPGNHIISVSGGVLVSAQNNNRQVYPFFTNYKTTIISELGKTVTIMPQVSYDPIALKYPTEAVGQFPEQFEGVGTIFKTTLNSDVDTIKRTDNPALVFDGNFSLLMEMHDTTDFIEFATDKAYSLPNNTRPVYLEVNYRTDVNLNIGLFVISNANGSQTEQSIITMLPTNNEWKKLYLNLTDAVSNYSNSRYKIYFKALHDNTKVSTQVLLDNFSVMYK